VTPKIGIPYYIDGILHKRKYVVSSSGSAVSVTSTEERVGPFNEAGGQCYHFTPVATATSAGTEFWSFPDQLANWNTTGINGKVSLSLEIYNRSAPALLAKPLNVSGESLPLVINNRPVELDFTRIELHYPATPSNPHPTPLDLIDNACEIVNLSSKRKLEIGFKAYHPDGYLAHYGLLGKSNAASGWTTWSSGSFNPSTGTSFTGVNPGTKVLTPTSSEVSVDCAYAIYLHAWARTTTGYHRIFHPHKLKTYYIQTP
jgi:hypothetical protein